MISLALAALIAAGISAAAGFGGAAINSAATRKANETNLDLNRKNNEANIALAEKEMAFNSAEAEKQRLWEAEQSNTAVQRRMDDLSAAGVNPFLAVGSPAQTGSGYAASATSVRSNAGRVEPVMSGDILNSLAHLAQSAAFMMALGKIRGDQADSYARSRENVANISAAARTRNWEQHSWKLQDGSWYSARRY